MQLTLKDDHPMMAWLPEHSGFLLSRFQVAADGKTAYERLKGKEWRGELMDFGEKVMYMPIVHGRKLNKLENEVVIRPFLRNTSAIQRKVNYDDGRN